MQGGENGDHATEEAAEKLENLSLSCDPAADSQVVPVILIVIIRVADPDQNEFVGSDPFEKKLLTFNPNFYLIACK